MSSEIDKGKHQRFVKKVIGSRRQIDVHNEIAEKGVNMSLSSISEFINLRDKPTKANIDKILLLIDDPDQREELTKEAYQIYGLSDRREYYKLLEEQEIKALKLALVDNDLSFKVVEEYIDKQVKMRARRNFDWVIEMTDCSVNKWYFEVKGVDEKSVITGNSIYQFISRSFYPITSDEKISLVVNDSDVYDFLLRRTSMRNMEFPFRGDMSIILVDTDKVEVVDEKYISHYYTEPEKQHELLLK